MTIKSLTITEEAYNALKRQKYTNESFSKTVIRLTKNKPLNVSKYLGSLKISEKEADDWKKEIRKRRSEISAEFSKKEQKFKEVINGSS